MQSPDGITEGIEFSDADFVLGIQWHPECMGIRTGTASNFQSFY